MRRDLNQTVSRDTIQKLLAVGHQFDLNKNGLYDARSGVVNVWASPEDKPTCWTPEITQGTLNFPRDYVGGLYWDWLDDHSATLYLDATPYGLTERGPKKTLTPEEWDQIFDWLKVKVQNLIRLAENTLQSRKPS